MPAFNIELKDAAGFIDSKLGPAIREGAKRGLFSAALRMVQEIQLRTIPATVPQPSARGFYKAAWRAEETPDGAEFFNTMPYAAMIEYGVRAGNVKIGTGMISSLADWVKMKGLARDTNEAWHIAWAIAKDMRKRGIFNKGTGLRIMERASVHLPQIVQEEVEREVERALGGKL
jgi:hypothetical protein